MGFGLGLGRGLLRVGSALGIVQILSLESGIIAPIRGKCEAHPAGLMVGPSIDLPPAICRDRGRSWTATVVPIPSGFR